MSRYELSVSPNYVKSWTMVQAIREIFQNALDQEIINPKNKMSYYYYQNEFNIHSKESCLKKSSLLFGESTKSDNKETIGKFGEGYKLALLVLLREGYKVIIYNYKNKETWTPKLVQSRRYNSTILVIDVNKHIFRLVPNHNLTFNILGITKQDYEKIIESCLFMNTHEKISTEFGDILLDKKFKQKIFINGLFICKSDVKLYYGYNFKPKQIELDRDRSLISSFNIQWAASKCWGKVKEYTLITDLIFNSAPDVEYIKHHTQKTYDIFNKFSSTYGLTAIPIDETDDILKINKQYPTLKPVIVPKLLSSVLKNTNEYKSIISIIKKQITLTPTETLKNYKHKYGVIDICKFNKIIEQSKNWINLI